MYPCTVHVTVSYGYRNAWYDYLKIALNQVFAPTFVIKYQGLNYIFLDGRLAKKHVELQGCLAHKKQLLPRTLQ